MDWIAIWISIVSAVVSGVSTLITYKLSKQFGRGEN